MSRTYRITDPRLVTTWPVLLAAGHSRAHVEAELAAGRWRRHGHAIVLHDGPPSKEQRWYIARMNAGRRALLTAFTAAEAYGLTGWERDTVHLVIPRGARVPVGSPVPVWTHRVRDWSKLRRHPRAELHALTDALLVAASCFHSPRPGCGLLAASVQQRLVSAQALGDALDAHPRTRHRGLLNAAVHDIAQGSQALSEIDFVRLCRRHAIPPPDQQRVRAAPSGRRRYLDASWRRPDGRLVVVEVDGALHLTVQRWWDDQARDNELALADALVLRFPSVIVRTDPALVARQLRRALGLPT